MWRLLTETGVALALVAVGLGWSVYGAGGDVVLTVLWVVGLVNGFNLMDNLDGACGSVACASAAGIGTLAALERRLHGRGLGARARSVVRSLPALESRRAGADLPRRRRQQADRAV